MVQDLFFEVLRDKTHIFCDAKDTAPVSELKKIIEGILKIPFSKQILVKFTDDARSSYTALDDKKTLNECGFSATNARAQTPAVIGLMLLGELAPTIADLSLPPPLPEAMRNDHNNE